MFRFYFRNMILTPITLISALILAAIMASGSLYDRDVLFSFQYTFDLGTTTFMIPVASVAPFFVFQRRLGSCRMEKLCLIRVKKRNYVNSAFAVTVLSGIVVMALAVVFFVLFCAIVWPPDTAFWGTGLFPVSNYELVASFPILQFLIQGLVFALNGAVWPAISFLCFSLTDDPYVIAAMPFIFRNVMGYVAGNLPGGRSCFALDPGQLLLSGIAREWIGGGMLYLIIYIGSVLLICYLVWNYSVTRRLQNE